MDRLTFSLPTVQMEWLRKEAESIGVSVGELLRRYIDDRRINEGRLPPITYRLEVKDDDETGRDWPGTRI